MLQSNTYINFYMYMIRVYANKLRIIRRKIYTKNEHQYKAKIQINT